MLFVAEMDGRLIATTFLALCRDVMYGDQPFGVLENVIVDSHFRKKGVGRMMMNWIKALCKSHQCTKIMLLTSSKRAEAHTFFETCGYRGDLKRGFVNYINRE
jgi:GNAT superfamily N-acetyltransferase